MVARRWCSVQPRVDTVRGPMVQSTQASAPFALAIIASVRMQILAIDIGTGTQDILLFDSEREIENCPQMVAPSPTAIVARRIRAVTAQGRPLGLVGTNMGGGPSSWAVRQHLEAGLPVIATPEAARTIDDDLDAVQAMGIRLAGEAEIRSWPRAGVVVLRDFDWVTLRQAFGAYDIVLEPDVVAVAVLDHGEAPPTESDRRFRFAFLSLAIRQNPRLMALAYLREEIPARMTRMQAVAGSVGGGQQVLVMDTPAAAVLGGLEDTNARAHSNLIAANLGNSHTLAFHLIDGRIAGLFEHHTGAVSLAGLESLLHDLGRGTLLNDAVFAAGGHGALQVLDHPPPPDIYAITGPRRSMMTGSRLPVAMAMPHGDMMLAGCFGLLRAVAAKIPELAPAIEHRLGA
jgi:uncharacterized protein (DUF1786 family)